MGEYMHIVTENLGVGMVMKGEEPQTRDVYCQMIKEFTDNLSIGPITQYEFASESRKAWLGEILKVRGTDYDFEVEQVVENLLLPLKMEEVNLDQKIIIWHADNVRDQMALRYLVSEYKEYLLYEVDLSQHILRQEEDEIHYVKTILECSEAQMNESFYSPVEIGEARKEQLITEWEDLKLQSSLLRTLRDGKIIDLEEIAYDEAILEATDEIEYKSIQSIIRDVMRKLRLETEEIPSKLWIEYRIKKMVGEGILMMGKESPHLGLVEVKKFTASDVSEEEVSE